MKYKNKYNEIEACKCDGVNQPINELPDWAFEEWEEGRLFIAEYGKDGKKGLFYSRAGKDAYRRYYIGAGSYLVKWPDGVITSVDKSVFERIFEKAE